MDRRNFIRDFLPTVLLGSVGTAVVATETKKETPPIDALKEQVVLQELLDQKRYAKLQLLLAYNAITRNELRVWYGFPPVTDKWGEEVV